VAAAAVRLVEGRLAALPRGLRDHVARVRAVGRDLAAAAGADAGRADFALAAHDLYRAVPAQDLLAAAAGFGMTPDAVERAAPWLLHGPIAALWVRREAGVDDRSILDAIAHHTTFAPGLDDVATVVFLADKLDPEKVERMPERGDVRDLAFGGRVREAAAAFLRTEVAGLIGRGEFVHPRAVEALNWLVLHRAGGAEEAPIRPR